MWIAVTPRFDKFERNIRLTTDQYDDGRTKQRGVVACLNNWYYEHGSETLNARAVGSWGKGTTVRPPRDVDVMFTLPYSVYQRISTNSGNIQSGLLQEVKAVLQRTYPSSDMRGDGQVVMVRFNSFNVEVVPAFLLQNGQYYICDTNNGGRWKATDPVAEQTAIDDSHTIYANNTKTLVRMMKVWQQECGVPLKSFHLELLMQQFLPTCGWSKNGYYWYDWLVRDFLGFLKGKANHTLFVPGTYEAMNIGNDWLSRCESAHDRAIKACAYEHADYVDLAGDEWKKIFGELILRNPL